MNILGISAFYHDSAAALIQDGKVVMAIQEERLTRKKHDPRFPLNAIHEILKICSLDKIDVIAYYEDPGMKLKRIISCFIHSAPKGGELFPNVFASQILDKVWVKRMIRRNLGFQGEIVYVRHHDSHAASAFYPSPFKEAAYLTVDGVGEWETTTYGVGRENQIQQLKSLKFPHSIGLLYAAFTYFTGFRVNSGEYKVMGLAPYGEPKYVQKILDHLIDVKEDGSFRLNMDYFDFLAGDKMINEKFCQLFDRPRRLPESRVTQDDMDFARSIQDVMEYVMLKMARHIRQETGVKNLCLAGGVALNCVANGKILKERIFDDIWIQPAAGDAGGALGAAMFHWFQTLGNSCVVDPDLKRKQHSLYGPEHSSDDIQEFLDNMNLVYEECEDVEDRVAALS